MKSNLFISLLLISLFSSAQDTIQLKDPGDGVMKLDQGWMYKMVDSPITADISSQGEWMETYSTCGRYS